MRARIERDVDGDGVGGAQQLVEVGEAHPELVLALGREANGIVVY